MILYSSGYESICRIIKRPNMRAYMGLRGMLTRMLPIFGRAIDNHKTKKNTRTHAFMLQKKYVCRFYHAPIATNMALFCFRLADVLNFKLQHSKWNHSQTIWKFSRKVLNIPNLNCAKKVFFSSCFRRGLKNGNIMFHSDAHDSKRCLRFMFIDGTIKLT